MVINVGLIFCLTQPLYPRMRLVSVNKFQDICSLPHPFQGISRSTKGYCLTLVMESMKTFSAEDGLSEEALLTKLRSYCYHQLFLHISLRNNVSGTCRWGEFGEGGRLWVECSGRQFEWYDGNPVTDLLDKVKELLGFDKEMTFRNTTVFSEKRPFPLHLGTASQIGVIPTEGIPSLLKVLLPSNCTGLPSLYIRDLILNPPAYDIASTIQATCKLINRVSCPVPEFTCFSSAKLVKLLELREVNHIEFCRIKNVADEVLHMYRSSELIAVLESLMDPTHVATGLKIDLKSLIYECEGISNKIGEIICLEDVADQKINSHPLIPIEFFEDMESLWKGRVKKVHVMEAYDEVDKAAEALSSAVFEDFIPFLAKVNTSTTSPLGGSKLQISYSREHQSVWFRGKGVAAIVLADKRGENHSKQLIHAVDSKGKRAGEEWFTTKKVEDALKRYHNAGAKAKVDVVSSLRRLSAELEIKINILVFSSTLLIIAKALFSHVSEGRRRKWVFPTLVEFNNSEDMGKTRMNVSELWPYWFDGAKGNAVYNTVDMQSLFILTGPNGGGKSCLLRSICAAALLGICGLMVPAKSAILPNFDSIMLHMKSYDSPADSKSSFQIEMSEIRSVISRATRRSLVLMDEICRGTETEKGTCIAGSIVETLDHIGCMGVVSTHLHGIPSLPLLTRNTVYKAMGTCRLESGRIKPTWKLQDGICRESLAFEMAVAEGIPQPIISRAEQLYHSVYTHPSSPFTPSPDLTPSPTCLSEVENLITDICRDRMSELFENGDLPVLPNLNCVVVAARELPPPSTVGTSGVYVMFGPDNKLYIGQTDDLQGRMRGHRAVEGMKKNTFLYLTVPGKSIASQLETLLINRLSALGFHLTNVADGHHRNFASLSIC